ncbi:MAG TPA: DUF424 family protein [Candidatus Thermoplasmatota archaeon]|nr:DUF424 family protein [Candidatus Thermoplasmatota archaeon]
MAHNPLAAVFRVKNYRQGREKLLAACDEEVLGRQLSEGKLRLHVSPDFYDGFPATEEEFEAQMRSCTIANLVGERVVDLAIKWGFVAKENVIRIEGVPHAQWALFL